jgi:transcriptional regulator with XRE-family HTH domain
MAKTFDLKRLDARRRKLGMSYASLAERSGVSMATVQRILSGNHSGASFGNVVAIALALDMSVKIEPTATATEVRHRRARQKAERLVSMVQATSGLEAQAVSAATISEMTVQTTSELLAGSPRQLWNN